MLAGDYCAVRCGARLLLPHYAYEYTGQGPNSENGSRTDSHYTEPQPNPFEVELELPSWCLSCFL